MSRAQITKKTLDRREFLKLGGLGFAGAALLGSVACGGGSEKPEGSIEVWIMQPGSDALEKLLDGFARDFEKANSGTKVNLQFVPWASAHDRFVTAIGGGQVPDVAEMGTTWTPEFGAMGAFTPLGGKFSPSGYVSSLVQSGQVNGKSYGLPWYGGVRTLIYRSDVLDKLSLEPPTSWDEIVEVGETVKGETDLYPFGAIGTDIHQYLPMVWQAGGEIAVKSGKSWESRMDSPEAAKAFDFYASLFREHKFSPEGALTWDSVDMRSAFQNGDLAMMIGGSWDVQGIVDSAPDLKDKIATVLLPQGPAGNRDAFAGGSHLVVFEESENKPTAESFVKFMTDPGRVNEFAQQLGFLPGSVSGVKSSPYTKEPLFKVFPEQILNHSRTYPPVPQWGSFEGEGIFVTAMQQIMRGDKSAEEALSGVAAQMNKEFKGS